MRVNWQAGLILVMWGVLLFTVLCTDMVNFVQADGHLAVFQVVSWVIVFTIVGIGAIWAVLGE